MVVAESRTRLLSQSQLPTNMNAFELLFNDMLLEAQVDLKEVAEYAEEQTLFLNQLGPDTPGYNEAVIATRDSIALKAGIVAMPGDDAGNFKLGMLEGAIRIASSLMY